MDLGRPRAGVLDGLAQHVVLTEKAHQRGVVAVSRLQDQETADFTFEIRHSLSMTHSGPGAREGLGTLGCT